MSLGGLGGLEGRHWDPSDDLEGLHKVPFGDLQQEIEGVLVACGLEHAYRVVGCREACHWVLGQDVASLDEWTSMCEEQHLVEIDQGGYKEPSVD